MSAPPEDAGSTYDAIVIGSGCAGLSAAITAHEAGLRVLLLEKSRWIGGATAVSGGALWLPGTAPGDGAEAIDSALTYLEQVSGTDRERARARAFLGATADTLRFFETRTTLRTTLRAVAPDYYPELPGARPSGRTRDTDAFDGRRLGRAAFGELRPPLAPFLLPGGMMVTVQDVRQLLAAHRGGAALAHALHLCMRLLSDRLRGYPRGTRLVLGNALAAQLFHDLLRRGVPYRLHTAAGALQRTEGSPTGWTVQAQGPDGARIFHARRGVVLATGGYPWDAARRAQTYPQPAYAHSLTPRDNTGDGIGLALAAGAVLGAPRRHAGMWAPVSVRTHRDGRRTVYPHLVWDRAKPGLIAVDATARRFVAEACSYHDFVQALYRARSVDADGAAAYLLCDAEFVRRWGFGLARPWPWRHGALLADGYLVRDASIAGLARRLGLDAPTLEATVTTWNGHARRGEDPEFGKGGNAYQRALGAPGHAPNPCVGPLEQPPFYALKVLPGDVGTSWGLRTNAHAQVLDAGDAPIPGLYAAGADLDSLVAGEYPAAGIALGPALVFGHLAARHLAGSAVT